MNFFSRNFLVWLYHVPYFVCVSPLGQFNGNVVCVSPSGQLNGNVVCVSPSGQLNGNVVCVKPLSIFVFVNPLYCPLVLSLAY
jgi:hypothetical protein